MPFRRIALSALAASVGLSLSSIARAGDDNNGEVKVHEFDVAGDATAATKPHETHGTYLSPGPLLSFVGGAHSAIGYGGEISVMSYKPHVDWLSLGFGGFANFQLYDGSVPHFALGGQFAFGVVGGELGFGYRSGADGYASTWSVETAIFVSLGPLVFGVRDAPQVMAFGANGGYGNESAIFVAVKAPFIIDGYDATDMAIDLRHH
jgi:hypothetical protein